MKPKVLLVDDEDFFRTIIAHGFEREGFTVLTADNGLDGLALAEKEKPELAILDIVMPGLHGFELCKKIRQNPQLSKTVIIMMSAKSYKPDIEKAKELGAAEYIIKPIEFDGLLDVVKKYLNADSPSSL